MRPALVVPSLKGASKALLLGHAEGLLVDERFSSGRGGPWKAAFTLRERFPGLAVAVLKEGLVRGGRR